MNSSELLFNNLDCFKNYETLLEIIAVFTEKELLKFSTFLELYIADIIAKHTLYNGMKSQRLARHNDYSSEGAKVCLCIDGVHVAGGVRNRADAEDFARRAVESEFPKCTLL